MIRVTGHFGEWMQGRLGADGPVALITLPCAEIGVTATQLPGAPGLSKRAQALISPDRAQAFLRDLGCALPGLVDLAADSPAGAGTGMSTGALVALARLAGADEAALPAACITAEGASDPLMLPAPDRVLWASRRGRVLAPAPPIPAALIVGGMLGPAEPTNPQDGNFPDITDLWRSGKPPRPCQSLRPSPAARPPAPPICAAPPATRWPIWPATPARWAISAPIPVPRAG